MALRFENVRLCVDRKSILAGVDWEVSAGETVAILGPNGSGKSTLLRLLCGYQYPTEGRVHCLGRQLGQVNIHQLRQEIGLVDPNGPFGPDPRHTTLEVVLTGFFGNLCLFFDEPSAEQVATARRALDEVGLSRHMDQWFRTLSTGEQRRALLARALVRRPKLLILDEPTAGLDLLARETMLAALDALAAREPHPTTLLVTHQLEELSPRTSNVLLLSDGRATASGHPEAVLTSENVSRAFGCAVTVEHRDGRWRWSVAPKDWPSLVDART